MALAPSVKRETRPPREDDTSYVLRIPPDAHTPQGFRDWATPAEVPERLELTLREGDILLETDRDGTLRIPASIHSLKGFRDWLLARETPEKLKATYLDGEVYLDMSLEEIRTHAAVKTAVCCGVQDVNKQADFGNVYINGVLITNKAAKVSNNPDGVAVFWKSLEAGRVRYRARKGRELEIEGAPDWVLEIVSRFSVNKDKRLLRRKYHAAGVREYWIIDARGEEIEFQLLCWRKSGYVAATAKDGWLQSRIFKCSFRLTRERDRRGAWKYQLDVKD